MAIQPSQLEIDNIVAASGLRLSNPVVPSGGTDTGTKGDISWDSDYLYVCTSGDTWKRAGITSWSLDPYFSSVALLLQDSLIDESPQGQTVAAIGDAAISTALAKVGTSSFSFDGNGDYLNIANDAAFEFGTGDFTIEAWVYLEGYTDNAGHSILGASTTGGIMLASLNGDLRIGRNLVAWDHTVNSVLTAQTWHHVAVSRSSGTLRMFVDGVEVLSAANSISYGVAGGTLFLGARKGANVAVDNFWHGYLDAIRFTSAARYTAAFTPPTAPFPS